MNLRNSLLLTLLGLLAALGGCVPKQQALPDNPYRIEPGGRPWIIAHGGAKALFPENTMMAFEGAMRIGVDALEMDVNLTQDDVLVTLHDLTIDGMSDGSGEAIGYTFAELQAFNFAHDFQALDGSYPLRDTVVRIPRLREVLEAFPGTYHIIELKNPGEDGKRAAALLKGLIDSLDMKDRVVIASFHDEVLRHFLSLTDGSYALSSSEEETKDFVFTGLSAMEYLYRPRSAVVAIPTESAGIPLDAQRVIRSAHRRNMAVQYWTINEQDEMRSLIEAGADGLITDRPDLMQKVLEEMGF